MAELGILTYSQTKLSPFLNVRSVGYLSFGQGPVMRKPLFGLGLALPLLAGCIATSMQGYADRELPTRPIQRIAVYVAAPQTLIGGLQANVVNEAKKRNIVAEDILDILPPTRTYADAEVKKFFAERGTDAVLLINVGDSGILREYAGTIVQGNYSGTTSLNGSAVRTGNFTTSSVTGTSQGTLTATSTPIYRHSRQTTFVARLIEAATGRALWVGNGEVQASGRFFVGDSINSASSVAAIFENLESKGVLNGGMKASVALAAPR